MAGPKDGRKFKRALVVVARQPVLGAVKTRLSQALGPETALQLYESFLADIITRFASGPYNFSFAVTPPDGPLNERWAPHFPQEGGSLNERLLNIFRRHRASYAGGTLVMSSDSPHVPREWIDRGFQLLEHAEVVLGPTDDGGYWIVGMREPHDIFSGVPMSTELVLAKTLELAKAQNLRVGLLPETFDIDTIGDVERLRAHLTRDGSASLPATARFLARFTGAKAGESWAPGGRRDA